MGLKFKFKCWLKIQISQIESIKQDAWNSFKDAVTYFFVNVKSDNYVVLPLLIKF